MASPRLLLLSYAFPPMTAPEAVLSAKRVGNLRRHRHAAARQAKHNGIVKLQRYHALREQPARLPTVWKGAMWHGRLIHANGIAALS